MPVGKQNIDHCYRFLHVMGSHKMQTHSILYTFSFFAQTSQTNTPTHPWQMRKSLLHSPSYEIYSWIINLKQVLLLFFVIQRRAKSSYSSPNFHLQATSSFRRNYQVLLLILPDFCADYYIFFNICFEFCNRLYISYLCPYAQRVWITRDYKVIYSVFTFILSNLQLLLSLVFNLQVKIPKIKKKIQNTTAFILLKLLNIKIWCFGWS